MDWRKLPSVTPGGKPFFYTRQTESGRRWVSWDRSRQRWTLTDERRTVLQDDVTVTRNGPEL